MHEILASVGLQGVGAPNSTMCHFREVSCMSTYLREVMGVGVVFVASCRGLVVIVSGD